MLRFLPLVVLVGMVACAHSQDNQAAPAAAPATTNTVADANQQAAPVQAQAAGMACTSDGQCDKTQICVSQRCADVAANLDQCTTQRVQFPFNSADLQRAQKDSLERIVRCLKAVKSMRMTIEGNADERGTEEYNLALGEQRAKNVAKYLTSVGVAPEALKTISYGKDQPLCTEHDEACWAKNRRASLKPAASAY